MLCRGFDERGEQRVRPGRPALELGVELTGDEPRVIGQLDHLHQTVVRGRTRHGQSVLLEKLSIFVIHFVTMSMTLFDLLIVIHPCHSRSLAKRGGVLPQPHGPTLLGDLLLRVHETNHRVRRVRVELQRIRLRASTHVSGELDDRTLQAEADPKEG